MSARPVVLRIGDLPELAQGLLGREFDVLARVPDGPDDTIRGIATNGKARIDKTVLDRLPRLSTISCLGAGTDGLDMEEIARRGIRVATTSAVLAADVADVAMGLVTALSRDFLRADQYVRERRWEGGKYQLGRSLSASRLGILGLGSIGRAVAARGEAAGMDVGYHGRRRQTGDGHRYFETLLALAEWSDFLVVCCPGGAATRHLVDADVLRALGPSGYLVNVARGSVVDERALVAALEGGHIAGCGLDVFETEPTPLPELLVRNDVILLPHIGSATVETREKMGLAMVAALTEALSAEQPD